MRYAVAYTNNKNCLTNEKIFLNYDKNCGNVP